MAEVCWEGVGRVKRGAEVLERSVDGEEGRHQWESGQDWWLWWYGGAGPKGYHAIWYGGFGVMQLLAKKSLFTNDEKIDINHSADDINHSADDNMERANILAFPISNIWVSVLWWWCRTEGVQIALNCTQVIETPGCNKEKMIETPGPGDQGAIRRIALRWLRHQGAIRKKEGKTVAGHRNFQTDFCF